MSESIISGVLADGTLIISGSTGSEGHHNLSTSTPAIHHVSSFNQFQAESWDGEHEEHEHHHDEHEAPRRFSIYLEQEAGSAAQQQTTTHVDDDDATPIASSTQFEPRARSASLAAALLELDPRGVPLVQFFKLATHQPLLELDEEEEEVEPGEAELVLSRLLFTLKMVDDADKRAAALQRLRDLEEELRQAGAVTPADPAVSDAVARALAVAGAGRDVQIRVNQSKHTTTTKTVYETETPGMAAMDSQQIRALQQQILSDISSQEHPETAAGTTQKKETAEEGFTNEDGSVVVSKKMTRVVTTTRTTLPGESSDIVSGEQQQSSAPDSPVESLGSVKDRIAKFEAQHFDPAPRSSHLSANVGIVITPHTPIPSDREDDDHEEKQELDVEAETSKPAELKDTREYQNDDEFAMELQPSEEHVATAEIKDIKSYSPASSEGVASPIDEKIVETSGEVQQVAESFEKHESDIELEPVYSGHDGSSPLAEQTSPIVSEKPITQEYAESVTSDLSHNVESPIPEQPPVAAQRHSIRDDEVTSEQEDPEDESKLGEKVLGFAKKAGMVAGGVIAAPVALAAIGAKTAYDKLKRDSDDEDEEDTTSIKKPSIQAEGPSFTTIGSPSPAPSEQNIIKPSDSIESFRKTSQSEESENVPIAAQRASPVPSERSSIHAVAESPMTEQPHVIETTTTTTVTREYFDEPAEVEDSSEKFSSQQHLAESPLESGTEHPQNDESESERKSPVPSEREVDSPNVIESTTTTTVTREFHDEPESEKQADSPIDHDEPRIVEPTTTTTVTKEYHEEPELPVKQQSTPSEEVKAVESPNAAESQSPAPSEKLSSHQRDESPVPSEVDQQHAIETTTTTTVTGEIYDEPQRSPSQTSMIEHRDDLVGSPVPSEKSNVQQPAGSPVPSEHSHIVETTTTTTVTREYFGEPESEREASPVRSEVQPSASSPTPSEKSSHIGSEDPHVIETTTTTVHREYVEEPEQLSSVPQSGSPTPSEKSSNQPLAESPIPSERSSHVHSEHSHVVENTTTTTTHREYFNEPEEPSDVAQHASPVPSEKSSAEAESVVQSEAEHPHVTETTTTTITTVTREHFDEPEEQQDVPSITSEKSSNQQLAESPVPSERSSHIDSEHPDVIETTTTTTTVHREYFDEPEEPSSQHESPVGEKDQQDEPSHMIETTTTTTITREMADSPVPSETSIKDSVTSSHVPQTTDSPVPSETEHPHVIKTTIHESPAPPQHDDQSDEEKSVLSNIAHQPTEEKQRPESPDSSDVKHSPEHTSEHAVDSPVPSEKSVIRDEPSEAEHVIESTTAVSRDFYDEYEGRQSPSNSPVTSEQIGEHQREEPVGFTQHQEYPTEPSQYQEEDPEDESKFGDKLLGFAKKAGMVAGGVIAAPVALAAIGAKTAYDKLKRDSDDEEEYTESSKQQPEHELVAESPAPSEKSSNQQLAESPVPSERSSHIESEHPDVIETTTTTTTVHHEYFDQPEETLDVAQRESPVPSEKSSAKAGSPIPSEADLAHVIDTTTAHFDEPEDHQLASPAHSPVELSEITSEHPQEPTIESDPSRRSPSIQNEFAAESPAPSEKSNALAGSPIPAEADHPHVIETTTTTTITREYFDEPEVVAQTESHQDEPEEHVTETTTTVTREIHDEQDSERRSPVPSEESLIEHHGSQPEDEAHVIESTTTTTVTREYYAEPEETQSSAVRESPIPSEKSVIQESPDESQRSPSASEKSIIEHRDENLAGSPVPSEKSSVQQSAGSPVPSEHSHIIETTTTTTVTREYFDEPESEREASPVRSEIQPSASSPTPSEKSSHIGSEDPHVIETTTTTTIHREYVEEPEHFSTVAQPASPIPSEKSSNQPLAESPVPSERSSHVDSEHPHVVETTTTTTIHREHFDEPEEKSDVAQRESPVPSEKSSAQDGSQDPSEVEHPHVIETTTTTTVTREFFNDSESPRESSATFEAPTEEEHDVIETTTTITREVYDDKDDTEPSLIETTTTTTTREVDDELRSEVADSEHPETVKTTEITREFYEGSQDPIEVVKTTTVTREYLDGEDEEDQPSVETTTTTTTVTREYFDEPESFKSEEHQPDETESPEPSEKSRLLESPVDNEEEPSEVTNLLSQSDPMSDREFAQVIQHSTSTDEPTSAPPAYHSEQKESPESPQHQHQEYPDGQSTETSQYQEEDPEDESKFGDKLLGFAKKAGMVAGGVIAAPVALAAIGAKTAYDKLKRDSDDEEEEYTETSKQQPEHGFVTESPAPSEKSSNQPLAESPVPSERSSHFESEHPDVIETTTTTTTTIHHEYFDQPEETSNVARHESPVPSEKSSAKAESPIPSEAEHQPVIETTTTVTSEHFDEPEEHQHVSPVPSEKSIDQKYSRSPVPSETHVVPSETSADVSPSEEQPPIVAGSPIPSEKSEAEHSHIIEESHDEPEVLSQSQSSIPSEPQQLAESSSPFEEHEPVITTTLTHESHDAPERSPAPSEKSEIHQTAESPVPSETEAPISHEFHQSELPDHPHIIETVTTTTITREFYDDADEPVVTSDEQQPNDIKTSTVTTVTREIEDEPEPQPEITTTVITREFEDFQAETPEHVIETITTTTVTRELDPTVDFPDLSQVEEQDPTTITSVHRETFEEPTSEDGENEEDHVTVTTTSVVEEHDPVQFNLQSTGKSQDVSDYPVEDEDESERPSSPSQRSFATSQDQLNSPQSEKPTGFFEDHKDDQDIAESPVPSDKSVVRDEPAEAEHVIESTTTVSRDYYDEQEGRQSPSSSPVTSEQIGEHHREEPIGFTQQQEYPAGQSTEPSHYHEEDPEDESKFGDKLLGFAKKAGMVAGGVIAAPVALAAIGAKTAYDKLKRDSDDEEEYTETSKQQPDHGFVAESPAPSEKSSNQQLAESPVPSERSSHIESEHPGVIETTTTTTIHREYFDEPEEPSDVARHESPVPSEKSSAKAGSPIPSEAEHHDIIKTSTTVTHEHFADPEEQQQDVSSVQSEKSSNQPLAESPAPSERSSHIDSEQPDVIQTTIVHEEHFDKAEEPSKVTEDESPVSETGYPLVIETIPSEQSDEPTSFSETVQRDSPVPSESYEIEFEQSKRSPSPVQHVADSRIPSEKSSVQPSALSQTPSETEHPQDIDPTTTTTVTRDIYDEPESPEPTEKARLLDSPSEEQKEPTESSKLLSHDAEPSEKLESQQRFDESPVPAEDDHTTESTTISTVTRDVSDVSESERRSPVPSEKSVVDHHESETPSVQQAHPESPVPSETIGSHQQLAESPVPIVSSEDHDETAADEYHRSESPIISEKLTIDHPTDEQSHVDEYESKLVEPSAEHPEHFTSSEIQQSSPVPSDQQPSIISRHGDNRDEDYIIESEAPEEFENEPKFDEVEEHEPAEFQRYGESVPSTPHSEKHPDDLTIHQKEETEKPIGLESQLLESPNAGQPENFTSDFEEPHIVESGSFEQHQQHPEADEFDRRSEVPSSPKEPTRFEEQTHLQESPDQDKPVGFTQEYHSGEDQPSSQVELSQHQDTRFRESPEAEKPIGFTQHQEYPTESSQYQEEDPEDESKFGDKLLGFAKKAGMVAGGVIAAPVALAAIGAKTAYDKLKRDSDDEGETDSSSFKEDTPSQHVSEHPTGFDQHFTQPASESTSMSPPHEQAPVLPADFRKSSPSIDETDNYPATPVRSEKSDASQVPETEQHHVIETTTTTTVTREYFDEPAEVEDLSEKFSSQQPLPEPPLESDAEHPQVIETHDESESERKSPVPSEREVDSPNVIESTTTTTVTREFHDEPESEKQADSPIDHDEPRIVETITTTTVTKEYHEEPESPVKQQSTPSEDVKAVESPIAAESQSPVPYEKLSSHQRDESPVPSEVDQPHVIETTTTTTVTRELHDEPQRSSSQTSMIEDLAGSPVPSEKSSVQQSAGSPVPSEHSHIVETTTTTTVTREYFDEPESEREASPVRSEVQPSASSPTTSDKSSHIGSEDPHVIETTTTTTIHREYVEEPEQLSTVPQSGSPIPSEKSSGKVEAESPVPSERSSHIESEHPHVVETTTTTTIHREYFDEPEEQSDVAQRESPVPSEKSSVRAGSPVPSEHSHIIETTTTTTVTREYFDEPEQLTSVVQSESPVLSQAELSHVIESSPYNDESGITQSKDDHQHFVESTTTTTVTRDIYEGSESAEPTEKSRLLDSPSEEQEPTESSKLLGHDEPHVIESTEFVAPHLSEQRDIDEPQQVTDFTEVEELSPSRKDSISDEHVIESQAYPADVMQQSIYEHQSPSDEFDQNQHLETCLQESPEAEKPVGFTQEFHDGEVQPSSEIETIQHQESRLHESPKEDKSVGFTEHQEHPIEESESVIESSEYQVPSEDTQAEETYPQEHLESHLRESPVAEQPVGFHQESEVPSSPKESTQFEVQTHLQESPDQDKPIGFTQEYHSGEDQPSSEVEFSQHQDTRFQESPEAEKPIGFTQHQEYPTESSQYQEEDPEDESKFGDKLLGFAKKAGMVAGGVIAAPVALAAIGAKTAYDKLKRDSDDEGETDSPSLKEETSSQHVSEHPSGFDQHFTQSASESTPMSPPHEQAPVLERHDRSSPTEDDYEIVDESHVIESEDYTHPDREERVSSPVLSVENEETKDLAEEDQQNQQAEIPEDVESHVIESRDYESPRQERIASPVPSEEDAVEKTANQLVAGVFDPLDKHISEYSRDHSPQHKKSAEELTSEAIENVQKMSYEEPEEESDWKVYDRHGEILEEFSTQLTDDVIQEAEDDASHIIADVKPTRQSLLKQESCQEVAMEPEVDYYSDLQEKLNILANEGNLRTLVEEEPSTTTTLSEQLDVIHESEGDEEEEGEDDEAARKAASELVDDVMRQVLNEEENDEQKTMTSDVYQTATEQSKDDQYDTCVTSQDDNYDSAQGWTSQDSEYTSAASGAPSRLSDNERQETSTPQAVLSPVDSDRHFTSQQDFDMPVIRAFDIDLDTARSTPDVALQVTIEEEDESDDKLPISPSGILLPPSSDPGRPISPVPPRKNEEQQFVFVQQDTPPTTQTEEIEKSKPSIHGISMEAKSEATSDSRYSRQLSDISSAESHAETVIQNVDYEQATNRSGSSDSIDASSVIVRASEEVSTPEDLSARSEKDETAEQLGYDVYHEEPQHSEELETVEEEPEDSDSLNGGGSGNSPHGSLGKYKHTSSDNLSLTSLQEFERLERELGARGDGSLTRSEIELLMAGRMSKSGEGSVSSLAEFERLEKEVTENISPTEEMMLSLIREESETEDMSTRDDDEEVDVDVDTDELKSIPVDERVVTPIAPPSPTDSLEQQQLTAQEAMFLETSTDSLEPLVEQRRPDSAEDKTSIDYEIVPKIMETSVADSLDGGIPVSVDKDSVLEGASQGPESQSTHGLLSGDTVGTLAEEDDKDSLDDDMDRMLRSYPTTLTTFQTTAVLPDGTVQTISRRVETRVTDPLVSHVTFTGTESQERLDQLPDDEQFETVDSEGNVTRTTFRRQPHQRF